MEKWEAAWQPMIDAIGKDFLKEERPSGADEVEKGAIRKYLEPLEFDCALHYDKKIAVKNGYENIIAPYSSLLTWTLPPYWSPGTKTFTSSNRNAQPDQNPLSDIDTGGLAPKTTGFFATDIEIDYIRPIIVGDRLRRVGEKLLSCVPKETQVGRGAFMVWESEIYNQLDDLIAKIRIGTYSYNNYPNKLKICDEKRN